MCGRFTATAAFDVLAERFGITIESGANEELTARDNVAPTQRQGPSPRHDEMGPPAILGERQQLAPINARAETVALSRLFGVAVRKGCCLVPATGFYEWQLVRGQKRRQPYFVRLKGGTPFAFAGLWTPPADAESPPTCVIIITNANELLAPIHNRMPGILDPDDEAHGHNFRHRSVGSAPASLTAAP